MKKLLLTLAAVGLTLGVLGQGAVIIDNNVANGYLDIGSPGGPRSHYTGPFGFELWYMNSAAAADPAINSLNGTFEELAGLAYSLLTVDGFTLATHINPGAPGTTAVGGIVSGLGEVDIPGINRVGNPGGNALFGVVFWVGGSTTWGGAAYGGVLTFNNPTSDYTAIPRPVPPSMDNWPVDLVMVIPEPGVFALAGLGAAVLLVFRRRQSAERRTSATPPPRAIVGTNVQSRIVSLTVR